MPATILPPLYARWADEFLGGSIPAEIEATCQQCALLSASPGGDIIHGIHPRTKCCGYYPDLSNFQVGNIINETDPAAAPARAVVAARVQAQFMATPTMLEKPPAYNLLYNKSPYMGSAFRLRCPYYMEDLLNGACGIWQHRNAICMTWFCKHVRGQVGHSFWRNALEPLFKHLESTLRFWCLTQLDLPDENLERAMEAANCDDDSKFTPEMLDETVDAEMHRALWGPWTGHEAEFYRECGQLVSALSAQEVLAIGGPEAVIRLRLMRKAYNALISADLPRVVQPGRFWTRPLGDGNAQVAAYSSSDPLVLPMDVLNLLSYFEGRTVDDALQAIRQGTEFEMEPALVRKLVDFGILVDAKGGDIDVQKKILTPARKNARK